MDLAKYLTVLVVLFFDGGETGGHGGKHHDHVKVHLPEFIHHDHHTKVITIHHHHHKPKKEHHHHHHHHHKPHIPHGHHYHHHHKKTHKTHHTESKGHHTHHGHHGHHGHHKHHGHHGHGHGHHGYGHGHQGHGHGHHGHSHGHHHHDTPVVSYDPTSTFEEDFGSFTPSVPSYSGSGIPQIPQVHGIQHTVKQVKVYDSLPGVLPNTGGSNGYQVTEESDDDDDSFTSVNGIQQTFPATYGYLRGAAPQPAAQDPFAALAPQGTAESHDPFASAPQPASAFAGLETFTGTVQNEPFASSAPTHNAFPSAQSSPEIPVSFQTGNGGFDDSTNSFAGSEGTGTAFLSNDEKAVSDDTPVSFSREAGIQQTIKTGGVETLVY